MSNQHVKTIDPQNERNAQIIQLSFELQFTSNQCAEMYALISSAPLLQKQFSDEKISSKNTNERCQAQHIHDEGATLCLKTNLVFLKICHQKHMSPKTVSWE